MAQRQFDQVYGVLGRKLVCIMGSFAPNGSSAVDAASNEGSGWSVAYTSTGLFTITFTDKFVDLVSATATLQLATGDDKVTQIGSYSGANKTLEIRVWDFSGAAVADVAADANNRINFCCWFSDATNP